MASLKERYSDNAPGPFYVDRTCIDCDACRRIAPAVFAEASDHSFVARQPADEAERRRALMALVACPTGSIGTATRDDVRPALAAYPETVEEEVSFCGFTSASSFGAWSYFVERPAGNVLVDSPKAVPRLLSEFERRGGVSTMFLTHKDDVADHAAFRKRFACERVLHEADRTRDTADVELALTGREPVRLADDLVAIPTPGHTRGHAVLLYRDKFLFTGDHLRVVPETQRPDRVPRRLLVLVEGADPFDGAPSRLLLRVGAARTRRVAQGRLPGRDAAGACELRGVDEGKR